MGELKIQYCQKCNHLTETEVVATYFLKSEIIAELQAEGTEIILLKCKNCNNPILCEEDFIQIEEHHYSQGSTQLYPKKELTNLKKAPKIIQKPYKEAVKCYEVGAYEACVIMVRKTIEAICYDKGITKGNLMNKIKKLSQDKLLDETFVTWADLLRVIGNEGAHQIEDSKITKDDASDSLEFLEALILYEFHLVNKYQQIKKRKTKRKDAGT